MSFVWQESNSFVASPEKDTKSSHSMDPMRVCDWQAMCARRSC